MLFDRPLIAIDIGSSSIKMVELGGTDSARRLNRFAVEQLPPGLVTDGTITDTAPVQAALSKLVKSVGVKGRRATVSIGGSGVLIKKIAVPMGTDVAIDEQVNYAAEQAFQIDPAELYRDHVLLPTEDGKDGQIDALVVGARREIIEQYVSVVRGAGMRIGVIECSSFSLANIFEYSYGTVDGLCALISIGASYCQMSFLYNGRYIFNRDIPFGGEMYTRRIMEALGSSFENAEAMKLSASSGVQSAPQDVTSLISEVNSQIVGELNSTVAYFGQSGEIPAGTVLKYAFLTGGACRTVGLDAAIAAMLQVPVYPLNPFQRLQISEKKFQMDQLMAVSPMLAVATGAGMRQKGDKE